MPSSPLRLLVAAGGTGGHVLPAVAVIDELKSRGVQLEVLWIGSRNGVERDIARSHDIPFIPIQTGKLRRYLSLETVTDMFRLPVGLAQAWTRVRRFRPDIIFSTGGNVSVPTVIAGARIAPILTHEQTAQVGIANKISARFAACFAASYEETAQIARGYHKNVVVTGNPVRATLAKGKPEAAWETFGFTPDLPVIFVTGGARGASAINQRIEGLLPSLLDRAQVVHQAGPSSANDDAARLAKLRESWPEEIRKRYVVREFLGPELSDLYAIADLVIGRAGAGTVAELAFLGKPSILMPLPGTWGDEQRKNAAVLARAGATIIVEQEETPAEALGKHIEELLADPARRQDMAACAAGLARPDAAARLADELLSLAGKR